METLVSTVVHDVKNRSSVNRFSQSDQKLDEKAKPLTCPKCKSGSMLKGNQAYGCSGYKTGCHFTIPFTHFNKTLTEKQLFQLLKTKKNKLD